MTLVIGGRRRGIWSSNAPTKPQTAVREFLWLAGLGVAALAYHAATRGRADLPPGYQGVFWIGAVMAGRLTTRTPIAATTTALTAGAVSLVPIWGLGDPFRPLEYLAAAGVIDIGFALLTRFRAQLWLLLALAIPLGGLAHATKPLLRVGINIVTGWPYGSLLWGVLYPTAWHFIFGAAGAAIAVTAWVVVQRARSASAE
jgi:hypothetical protein